MAELLTLRERARTLNTLAALLKGLEGHVTLIDLRNEASVRGRVVSVDSCMNVTLKHALYLAAHLAHPGAVSGGTWANQNARREGAMHFDDFYVQARNVRFVHIPETLDILSTIHSQLTRLTSNSGRVVERSQRSEVSGARRGGESKAERKVRQRAKLEQRLAEMRANLGLIGGDSRPASQDQASKEATGS